MILIHPPVAKPSEPPAGLAKLAGALKHHRLMARFVDANLEALEHRLKGSMGRIDRWTNRAAKHLSANLASLCDGQAFRQIDHYKRSVLDINRVVQAALPQVDGTLSLVNYTDSRLSPVRSQDLIRAAEQPEGNPYYDYFRTRLDDLMEEQPSRVGISLNYLSQALCAFALAGYLRKKAPGLKIIMGGGLVSSWMAALKGRNPFAGLIDELIPGPGEGPLLLRQGIEDRLNHYRPDYTAFRDNRYLSPGFILPYSASSGCYWNQCSFCPECAEKNRYRPVSSQQVLMDLEVLIEETRPVLVHLLDNALSPVLLKHLCQNPLSAPWYGFARMSKELTDPDYGRALKRAGCVMLKLGLESGDQTVLDRLNKGIDLETASGALDNLKAAGIETYVYVLFGTPAEDLRRARRTLDFLVRHSRSIDFLNLAIFNLPIHSPDARDLETDSFYEGDLSLYRQFRHPLGWDRPLVRQFLDQEVKRHPAVAAILRRDPPLFTSNHAPFLAGC
jgi:radical SAM superfamily enzyme YgiQ (UPF0313 family)